jgi:hypothetical protein
MGVAFAVLMLILIGCYFLMFVCFVLKCIFKWITFKKLGLNGWEALIPFYNTYASTKKITGSGVKLTIEMAIVYGFQFLLAFLWMVYRLSYSNGVLDYMNPLSETINDAIVDYSFAGYLIAKVIIKVWNARYAYILCKALNHDVCLAIVCALFPPIGYGILALGKRNYNIPNQQNQRYNQPCNYGYNANQNYNCQNGNPSQGNNFPNNMNFNGQPYNNSPAQNMQQNQNNPPQDGV